MSSLIKRTITKCVQQQLEKYPILALTGPRQSGKTTLLKKLFPEYQYISMENPDTRAYATEDPHSFLDKYNSKVIIDEAQRVPELFSYLQTKVDESRIMGNYILSGSQNFHLIKSITQSLAGRVALFKLLPFDFQELKVENLLLGDYTDACFKGFYPAIYDREINPTVFYYNYIQTYIEKDITELINIRDIVSFRRFLSACAVRSGHLLNITSLANECDISQPTAKSWLSVLESSYILFRLQPYHKNFNKRIVKSPKLYFYDSGLLCHLLEIKNAAELNESNFKGHIFETMIVSEFQKRNQHLYLHKNYYFWQDSNKKEVDLLLKNPESYLAYEIKSTKTVNSSLFKSLDNFENIVSPEKVEKKLIYGGLDNHKRKSYEVVSWKDIEIPGE